VPVNTAEATEATEATATSTLAAEPTLAPTTATAAEASLPACVVSPEMTEGPYFVDEKLNRSDIRSNTSDGAVKEGVPLALTLRVAQVSGGSCAPLAGAVVDIWHCDALGVYSDATDRSFNTVGQDFLRGYQVSDANGFVNFTTIFPGWYQGRAVHIHFKVRGNAPSSSSQSFEFTSQFFFDEALCEQVYAQVPYASKGSNFLRNEQDNIYRGGGDQTTLALAQDGQGYKTTFDIGVQLG
jgi:protocatechuate 3,4-dioxygenase beta subunit